MKLLQLEVTTYCTDCLLLADAGCPKFSPLPAVTAADTPGLNPTLAAHLLPTAAGPDPASVAFTAPCFPAPALALPETVPAKLEARADLAAAVVAGPAGPGDLPLGRLEMLALGDLALVLPGGLPTGLPVLVGALRTAAGVGSAAMVLRRMALDCLPPTAFGCAAGGAVAGVAIGSTAAAGVAAAVPTTAP